MQSLVSQPSHFVITSELSIRFRGKHSMLDKISDCTLPNFFFSPQLLEVCHVEFSPRQRQTVDTEVQLPGTLPQSHEVSLKIQAKLKNKK